MGRSWCICLSMSRFLRHNIASMQGYAYGEQPEDPGLLKLNTNENACPPAPGVRELLAGFDAELLRLYPSPTALGFRHLVAELLGIGARQIIATRGGDELLRLLFTSCMNPGDRFGMVTPGYSLYPSLAAVQGCELVRFPLNRDFSLPADLAGQMNRQQIRMTCLINPHAPSGHYYSEAEIRAFLDAFEGLLLLDEAYVDFVDPQLAWPGTRLLAGRDQLVILRSLSKGYSLAGIRLGYGVGPESLIQAITEKTRDSYNLDSLSQAIGMAAIQDREHAENSWRTVRQNRAQLRESLQQLGLVVPPGQGNFLLAFVPEAESAEPLYRALRQDGILVRWFDEPGIRQALRITVGRPAWHARLLESLARAGLGAG